MQKILPTKIITWVGTFLGDSILTAIPSIAPMHPENTPLESTEKAALIACNSVITSVDSSSVPF